MASGRRVVAKDESSARRVSDAAALGAIFRAERLRRGLSQEAMGALLGLTRQKVQQLEAGATGMAIGAALGALVDLGVALIAVPSRGNEIRAGDPLVEQGFLKAADLLRHLDFQRGGR